MTGEPVVLDTDTLSELSRGNANVNGRAREYLDRFGRLTITAVTVFERLRGYRSAIRRDRPFESQLQAFVVFVGSSIVLPFDEGAAIIAAELWAAAPRRLRHSLGDILIASIAASRQLPLVTRNQRDFIALRDAAAIDLRLLDWSKPRR